MNASGAARTEINIKDYSTLIDTALKGKTGYLGVTERGEIGKIYDIGSADEYRMYLGTIPTDNNFPLYCNRVFDNGGRLKIVPAGKYANPTDKTSLLGVKASRTITQTTASAAGATAAITASGAATADGTVSVIVSIPGQADVTIASAVAVTDGDTAATIIAAMETAIDAGTGTHGFSSDDASTPRLDITAPASLGAFGRNATWRVIVSDPGITFNAYAGSFTGGSDATSNTGTLTMTAKAKGDAYNNVSVQFKTAASNSTTKYDIVVSISDNSAPTETYADVPKLGSSTDWAAKAVEITNKSILLGGFAVGSDFVFQPGTYTLTGGTDGADLIPSDYVGNSTQGTNMYAFDADSEITKICIPNVADGTLAKSLADYVDNRKDIIGLHRTPLSLLPNSVVEYRTGTGAYSHLPIDSWRNLMFSDGIRITHPVSQQPVDISGIGDITGIIATKDNKNGEWWSFAGEERGVLRNVLDVLVNVGTPGMIAKANDYANNGIIPVIKDPKNKIYIDGDVTLYRTPSLLQAANVAELLVFMYRSLNAIIPKNYNPNDVESWKAIYRKVVPFIQYLANNRAIWNDPAKPDDWYKGDQNIMDVSQAVVNASPNGTSIDAGLYKFKLYIKPKRAMKYIEVTVAVTNSGVDFSNIEA